MSNYIVKAGNMYATGSRTWSQYKSAAFVFRDEDTVGFAEHQNTGKKWAISHASSFPQSWDGPIPGPIRVVKLVKRAKAAA